MLGGMSVIKNVHRGTDKHKTKTVRGSGDSWTALSIHKSPVGGLRNRVTRPEDDPDWLAVVIRSGGTQIACLPDK